MTAKIRPARSDEALPLAGLDAVADDHPWTARQYSAALAGRGGQQVLVLDADRGIVGAVVMAVGAGEGSIHRIFVAGAQRDRGLGRTLLRAALERLRAAGAARCQLEVRASNRPALALYASAGFSLDGRRKRYYSLPRGREDALLLSCNLKD